MAKTINFLPELKKILEASMKRDHEGVLKSAEPLVEKLVTAGEMVKAERLRVQIEKCRQMRVIKQLIPMPHDSGLDFADLYAPAECKERSKRLVLNETNRVIIDEFIGVQQMRDEFEAQEVPMPNKIVMFGPPGTGKSLTAYHLASTLDLPLVVVRLDAIVSSYMGNTGKNIRKIFEYATKTPCVLFLDEFDAIAKDRNDKQDVGELSRVVNSLLQNLDTIGDETIVIAATNLEESLDKAVWRRFDTRMKYELPSTDERLQFMSKLAVDNTLAQHLVSLAEGLSFADIEQIVMKGKRKAIVNRADLEVGHLKSAYAEYTSERNAG